jgi:exonuclease SbcC
MSVSLQSQLATLQQQEGLESERLQQSQAQFAAALAASCFADQEAFLPRCWMTTRFFALNS